MDAMERPNTGFTEDEEDLSSLRQTDIEVLKLLGGRDGTMAFQGLRRMLNMHQEKLSRSLQRLESDGLVERTPKGYLLTSKGQLLAHRWFLSEYPERKTILKAFLPGDVSPMTVVQNLEGKWLGSLRWLGISESDHGTTLHWMIDETGTEISLRIEWGNVAVETDARTPEETAFAFVAAQQLFAHLVVPYRQDLSPSNVYLSA